MILHIAPVPAARALALWTETTMPVENLELSVRFYREALGLEVAQLGNGWLILRDPDSGQQLCLRESATHAHPAISLHCSDFEAALAHLEEAGAVEVYAETSDTFKHATVRDPDGHEIFLWWEG